MKTNGQQKPARGKEVLLGAGADQRMLVSEQRYDRRSGMAV